ncbi:PREDICTED: E3 ubiquitin-protein ligase HUWE1-like, partial [Bison bison bison]|uniref:E3 ubiquitin-protein ligase HUWE1-like n=1 Tax=Bison bison bison TaxID=43346 RepID=A0A6P3GR27_BISBB
MDEAPSNLSQASTLQANREDSMNILDPEDEEEHTQEEDSSGSNEDEDDSQDEEEEEEEDEEDDQVRGDCVWVGSDNLFHGNTAGENQQSGLLASAPPSLMCKCGHDTRLQKSLPP